jgi:anaerobic magnesium-protoporphyrin IX monomethyl ester cyclase
LQVDNIVSMSPIKISRRDALKAVVLPDEESTSCSASPVLQAAV